MNRNQGGRPRSETSSRALAERLTVQLGFPVTKQQIGWWRRKGYDLADLNRLRRSLLDQSRLPEGCDPNRLRRDMASPTPEHAFGRRLREMIEGMPCAVIGQIRAEPEQAMSILCAWVMSTLRELVKHPGCPDGLPLTDEELAGVAEYVREEREKRNNPDWSPLI